MSPEQATSDPADEPRWLTPPAERSAWLAMAALTVKLPGSLDAQLQRDQGISFFEYMVLSVLSERADRTLQMSFIAEATSSSLSRLSHTAKRLEGQGLLRRERIPRRRPADQRDPHPGRVRQGGGRRARPRGIRTPGPHRRGDPPSSSPNSRRSERPS